jgi:hypothetical protein
MALSREDLESITRANYSDAMLKYVMESELIPTEPNELRRYYAKKEGRAFDRTKNKELGKSISDKMFNALPVENFGEDATKPAGTLTEEYISMMDAGEDDTNVARSMEILYGKDDK